MIEIDEKLVSLEIFDEKFVCDLNSCKGACCVKGDSGAPLLTSEINLIEDNIDEIKKTSTTAKRKTTTKNKTTTNKNK